MNEEHITSFLTRADALLYKNAMAGTKYVWMESLSDTTYDDVEDMVLDFLDSGKIPSELSALLKNAQSMQELAMSALNEVDRMNAMTFGGAIPLANLNEIREIHPEYISKFVDDITKEVGAAVKDKNRLGHFAKRMVGKDNPEISTTTYKMSIARTSLPYEANSKYILDRKVFNRPWTSEAFPMYTDMLRQFALIQAAPGGVFEKQYAKLKVTKKRCDDEMTSVLKTVKYLPFEKSLLGKVAYVILTAYIELVKYAVALMMRNMVNWMSNVRVITNKIYASIPQGESLITEMAHYTESVDTIDAYETAFQMCNDLVDASQKMLNDSNILSDVEPFEEIDTMAYRVPSKAFELFHEKLIRFLNVLGEMSPKTVAELAAQEELLSNSFWDVVEGKGFQSAFLPNQNFHLAVIKRELMEIPVMMSRIKSSFSENCMEPLKEAMTKLQVNENGWVSDEVKREEAMELMKTLDERFRSGIKEFMNKFATRLDLIKSKGLDLRNSNEIVAEEMDRSFFGDLNKLNYEIVQESADDDLTRLNQGFLREYVKSVCGPFFEDDNNQTDKPKVQDNDTPKPQNTNNQHQNTNNQQQNNTNKNNQNNQNQNDNGKQKISERLSEALQKMINSITDFIHGKGTVNKKSLDFHRNYLMQRAYSNISVDVVPYIKRNYADITMKFVDNALGISDENLKTMSKDQIANAVFAPISFGSAKADNGDDSLLGKFTNALAVGAGQHVAKKFSNSEVKLLVNDMIAYVENYYADNGLAQSLGKIAFDKLNELDQKAANAKDDDPNDHTKENINYIKSLMSTSIVGLKRVTRDRLNDYMTVLQNVWANDPAGKATNQGGVQTDQNDNGQQKETAPSNDANEKNDQNAV